ncbi:8088_t:CDS:2 [Paraglomus occultum]|uniref:8088_t:CDS:1 n=1 Tax=Paraglomus occultum TaxID=144539 RepID=A0A9N9AV09_9GLOM|nr:8088_t:CDS:2 [Paraglomus occultum]
MSGPSRAKPTNISYGATSQSLNTTAYGATLEASRMQIARSLGAQERPDYHAVDIPKAKKAEIIRQYLVSPDERGADIDRGKSPEPYQLHGGDTAHDFYKWQKDVEAEPMKRTRSRSLTMPRASQIEIPVSEIRAPGGFRRYHMKMKAVQEGKEPPNFVTQNSIDFLAMIHHFAESHHAAVSASGACLLLLKSFVGTGVMFLPRAFLNGGMIFSTAVLIAIAIISLFSFLLLVETRQRVPGSFGEIGRILYGPRMRLAVLFSITISQIGFVCAYMIFVAKNLFTVAKNALNMNIALKWFIIGQVLLFVPMSMIRKIGRLSFTALIADAFILFGLGYLYYYDILKLSRDSLADIKFFNNKDFALFIGTAVFTFEGIGLIIPITESMKEPEKFPKVLTGVMIFITILFTSIGVLSYAAFGSRVETVIILNLPNDSPTVQAVQLLYALAIVLSIPLQLFPAIRIMEQGLFEKSGKDDTLVKWQKNLFRAATVVACALIAWSSEDELDKFVSLIGSFACVPLCFLYPPLFHLRGRADTVIAKILDVGVLLFGVFALLYTTYVTMMLWSDNDK